MTADRDTTRIVRAWLRIDEHESADRVLAAVLADVDTTPQRRHALSARRVTNVNSFARVVAAGVAVVVVAVLGANLLPSGGTGGGDATPAPSLRPEPTPIEGAAPPAGDLAIGRYHWTQNGIGFSLDFRTEDWRTNGVTVPPDGSIVTKGNAAIWMPMWSIDGVFDDPCGHVAGPVLSPSATDLASAVAGLPGFEVLVAPEVVTLGGRAATHVVIRATGELGCDPADYYMWYDDVRCDVTDPCHRYAATVTQTNRVWIWEVDGRHIWIEAETKWDAAPALEEELEELIASIEFDP